MTTWLKAPDFGFHTSLLPPLLQRAQPLDLLQPRLLEVVVGLAHVHNQPRNAALGRVVGRAGRGAEEGERRRRRRACCCAAAHLLALQRVDDEPDEHRVDVEARRQVVDAADSITYDAHDTDDAIKLGLVSLEEFQSLDLIGRCLERIGDAGQGLDPENLRRAIVHELIDCQVGNVLASAGRVLKESGWEMASDAQQDPYRIEPTGILAEEKSQLESFLLDRVYHHPKLIQTRDMAQKHLQRMFEYFSGRVEMLPPRFRNRIEQVGLERSIGDYLAGMTDRYLENCYREQFPNG